MADQNNNNRSGFPPNLNMNLGGQGFAQGGGDQAALWNQLAQASKNGGGGGGQQFNPTDSSHRLQQNGQNGSPQQQQASLMLQKALQQQQQARAGAGQGGAQLQMPSGQGGVNVAGQHALLQALLASNQHQQGNNQQQQQFGNGLPQQQFNQNQFNLQLPNQQQQQHQNPQLQQHQQQLLQQQMQQQQQQNPSSQPRSIPPGIQQMLAQMGAQGNSMLKDWQQGNMTGDQMVQLKAIIAAHQARNPKPNADMSQQQQQQHNPGHERNLSNSSQQTPQQKQQQQQSTIATMTNDQLQSVISQLGARLKQMEGSLQQGTVAPQTVDRARGAVVEWAQQLRGLVREAQNRNLNVGNLLGASNGNNNNTNAQNNMHSSPNPAYGAIPSNSQADQFSQNTFNASPNPGPRPTPQSYNQTLPTSSPSLGSTDAASAAQRTVFFQKLAAVWTSKGIKIEKTPQVEGRNLDLYDLYHKVTKQGGSEFVRNQNLWPVIGAQLGLGASTGGDGVPRSTPDAANQVADIFMTFLSSFEDVWRAAAAEGRRRGVNQSPQLNLQQNAQFNNNPNQQPSGQAAEFNDAVLERLSQVPASQRESLNIPPEVLRRLEVYIAQKTLNASNNAHSSPQVQAGLIGQQQQQQQNATIAWTKQQQQYAEASQRLASSNGAVGAGGVPPRTASAGGGQDGPSKGGFVLPTPEASVKSKTEIQMNIARTVENLRVNAKEIDGLSDQQKVEIKAALRAMQTQVLDAEKRLIMYRILSNSPEAATACQRAIHMIAMYTHAGQQVTNGRFVISQHDLGQLAISLGRFITYAQTAVQSIMARNQSQVQNQNPDQARLMQQQYLQQQQQQAAATLQQQQQQMQQQNQNQHQQPTASTSSIPDPSSFAPASRLRAEDLRAPPPPKRARTSSVGGIASPSPAATTPAELKTPINPEQSPPATGKSPASGKKGSTPKDSKASTSAAAKREKLSRKSSTGGASRSTLDQVKEEKRDGEMQPSVQEETTLANMQMGGGPTDPASVLGLQMDGWEERRRQEEVRAASKDPVSFFQAQWNNLQQTQMNASNGGSNQMLQTDASGIVNGIDHTALARAMRDIRQPSSFGSSASSSYPPVASSSHLPYHSLGYGSLQHEQQQPPSPEKPPVDDGFDISFFIDASQYEDEDEDEVVTSTEGDGGPRVGSNSSGTTDPRAPDAQTPDLLHSGGPHDESPASVKEAISPPRLLPFRSATSTGDSNNLPLPTTNRTASNPFSRTTPSSETNPPPNSTTTTDPGVLIPPTGNDGSNSVSAKSISPLPLETPNEGENGLEIWASEMGEDSYYGGGGGDFNWEGSGGMDGAGWLINSS